MSKNEEVRFKVGNRISLRSDPKKVGTVIDAESKGISCGYMAYVDKYTIRLDNEILTETYYAYDLNLVLDIVVKKEYSNGCECGARFTSETELHMRMCPKFKEPM